MLELIVLGQIPGTNFQITFWQVVGALATLIIVIYSLSKLSNILKPSTPSYTAPPYNPNIK